MLIALGGVHGRGRFALVDDEDAERVSARKWRLSRDGYVTGGKRTVMLHRFIMGALGRCVVDHINGDKLDNRRANLRVCTQSDNAKNRRAHENNTSGARGVIFRWRMRSRPWYATIQVNGKKRQIGYFATLAEASAAYEKAARASFGEFYRPLQPTGT